MNSTYRLFPVALVALLTINSCKNDGCNDPIAFNYDPDGSTTESCVYEPKQIELTVNPVFGASEAVLNDTFEVDNGRALVLKFYAVYISNISFKEKNETDYAQWNLNHVALIKDKIQTIEALYLNKSEIEGMRFDVGVDTAVYKGDPTVIGEVDDDSPLAMQDSTMWWGWASGYRFISIEGLVDISSTKDGSAMTNFAFHCGLPANLKTITMDSTSFIATGNKMNLALDMDIEKLLLGVDFQNGSLIVDDGNQANTIRIMNNAMNAFTLK